MLEAPPLTRTRRMPVVLGGVSCKPEVYEDAALYIAVVELPR